MAMPTAPDLPRRNALQLTLASAAALASGSVWAQTATPGRKVEVLGHRGACALRPEHTLASYALAIRDGADFIEPDLVCTKDGVLVARHENNLSETTDVAQHAVFASRRTRKTIDGQAEEGWFVEDFTLAELKRLRAIERIPKIRPGNTVYDGQFQVPTFEDIIDFVAAQSAAAGRPIGLVPELKHSTYHAAIGLPLEDRFVQTVQAHHHTRTQPLIVQSFEVANLKALRQQLGQRAGLRLMQLVGSPSQHTADSVAAGQPVAFGSLCTPEGLHAMAAYADIFAPPTRLLINWDAAQRQQPPSRLIPDAHAAKLQVHTWTLRPENRFMAADFRSDAGENARHEAGAIAEARSFVAAGVDGFFTDDPALGRVALQA
jgi:glycerophosphoryl diester phosphodiesterase